MKIALVGFAEVVVSLIASSVSIFGFLFVLRTLAVFRARALVRPITRDAIGVGALVCFSLVLYFAPVSLPSRASLGLVFALAVTATLHTLERRRLNAIKARVPLFLDQWILNLRLGASLAAARDAALNEEDADVRALLRPVFDARLDPRQSHLLLPAPVLRELNHLARASHAALDRLESLRRGLRDVADFRRKSGQAVRQAAIQSTVMVILLIALSVFTVRRYGWAASGGFVTGAAALSVIGAALMIHLSRKRRWTL